MRTLCAVFAAAVASASAHGLRSIGNHDGRVVVNVYAASQAGQGQLIGEVTLRDSNRGLILQPAFTMLPPGHYGFFVNSNADCRPAKEDGVVVAAGKSGSVLSERAPSHAKYPVSSKKHEGALGSGLVGDLPAINIEHDMTFGTPVVAPRLRLADVMGRSLVIMDSARLDRHPNAHILACGVVPGTSVDVDNSLALSVEK